jgi:hypothetical protein
MRLRPQNFPTIRLAQFAALIVQCKSPVFEDFGDKEINALRNLFTDPSKQTIIGTIITDLMYNPNHHQKTMGRHLLIFCLSILLALFLFSYGKQHQQQYYISRAALKLIRKFTGRKEQYYRRFC